MKKPQYIREIEEHTGLRCVLFAKTRWGAEWNVLSPTGVVLMKVSSGEEDIIGGVESADMYFLQGISFEERFRRRSLK